MLVPLTRGQYAIIDEADAPAVANRCWVAQEKQKRPGEFCAAARIFGAVTRMHSFLWLMWGLPPASEIDHKNGDSLDNRRENLRAATRSQNVANTGRRSDNKSGYKGVYREGKRWRAHIRVNGKSTGLGAFDTPQEAHAAYMAEARRLFGEFARAS